MADDYGDKQGGFDSPIPIAKVAESLDGSEASAKLMEMGLSRDAIHDDLGLQMQSISTEATTIMAQSRTLLQAAGARMVEKFEDDTTKGDDVAADTQALLDAANTEQMVFHPSCLDGDLPIEGSSSLNHARGFEDEEAKDDTTA